MAPTLPILFVVNQQRTLERKAGRHSFIAQAGHIGRERSMNPAHADEMREHGGVTVQLKIFIRTISFMTSHDG